MRRKLLTILIISCAALTLTSAAVFWKKRHDDNARDLASYYVPIGASKQEVGYRLGYPNSVQGPLYDDPTHKNWQLSDELKLTKNGNLQGERDDPPGGTALKKYDEWHYYLPPDRVDIQFDPETKKVASIACQSWKEGAISQCKPLFGIPVGSADEEVVRKLGHPSKQDITDVFKSMDYPALGIELMLTKGRVYLVRKVNPAANDPR